MPFSCVSRAWTNAYSGFLGGSVFRGEAVACRLLDLISEDAVAWGTPGGTTRYGWPWLRRKPLRRLSKTRLPGAFGTSVDDLRWVGEECNHRAIL